MFPYLNYQERIGEFVDRIKEINKHRHRLQEIHIKECKVETRDKK